MMTLTDAVRAAELDLKHVPEFDPVIDKSWDNWFARNARRYRRTIGMLIMDSGMGFFHDCDGTKSMVVLGVAVDNVDDGYRGLLSAWVDVAQAKLARSEAVAS